MYTSGLSPLFWQNLQIIFGVRLGRTIFLCRSRSVSRMSRKSSCSLASSSMWLRSLECRRILSHSSKSASMPFSLNLGHFSELELLIHGARRFLGFVISIRYGVSSFLIGLDVFRGVAIMGCSDRSTVRASRKDDGRSAWISESSCFCDPVNDDVLDLPDSDKLSRLSADCWGLLRGVVCVVEE